MENYDLGKHESTNPKFRVGDKVKILQHDFGVTDMDKRVGEIHTVTKIDVSKYSGSPQYYLDYPADCYIWHEGWLEAVSSEKCPPKTIDICTECIFSLHNCFSNHIDCKDCFMGGDNLGKCRCESIDNDEPCPYFKPTKKDAVNSAAASTDPKFRVGDKVRVVKVGFGISDSRYIGLFFEIKHVNINSFGATYEFKEDPKCYFWDEPLLELVTTPATESINTNPEIDTGLPDSGNRECFETGAVRDIQSNKGRRDLLPLEVIAEELLINNRINNDQFFIFNDIELFKVTGRNSFLYSALDHFCCDNYINTDFAQMYFDLAMHFEAGAKKYGENNWKKGIPTRYYIASATGHYLKWLRGDTDESHDRAFVWNLVCCIWTCIHKPELNDYGKKEKQ